MHPIMEDDEDSRDGESDEDNIIINDNIFESFTSFPTIEFTETKSRVEERDGDTIIFGEEGEASLSSHIAADLAKETSPVPFIYGIDQVGTHIETIRSWIEQVYRISQTLSPPSKFLIPNLLSSYNDSSDDSVEKTLIPMDVGVTSEMEESLKALSSCLEYAANNDDALLKMMVENVASIPSLMKTIILIEVDNDRKRVLAYPIIKRVMLCKNSIIGKVHGEVYGRVYFSSWFVDLLKTRDASLGSKVVDYFELVSSLTAQDFIFAPDGIDSKKNPTPTVEDTINFNEKREEFFEVLHRLPTLMPSMLLLKECDIERASVTSLIRHILDWNLSRPFGVSVVFFDLLSYLLLVFGFRPFAMSSLLLERNNNLDDVTVQQHIGFAILILLGLISLLHLIFRHVGEGISMLSISWKVFGTHFFSFWNLVCVISIGSVSASFVIGLSAVYLGSFQNFPLIAWFDLVAISIGFLWLNLLGFLKIVNRELATFILAIAQILKDIRLFLGVILILVLASGDMLFLKFASNENICPENFSTDDNSSNIAVFENLSPADQTLLSGIEQIHDKTDETLKDIMDTNPYCVSRGQSYLGVYRVLIGDFSLDHFNGTKITTVLFVLITFFGIIIFLNVLIALVCESYEKSQLQANRLFGRARVTYVSAIIALESLIFHRATNNNNRRFMCSCSRWIQIFMFFFSITIALMVFLMLVLLSYVLFNGFIILGWNEGLAIFIVVAVIAPLIFGWFVVCSFFFIGSDSGKWNFLAKIQNCVLYKYLFVVPIMFITCRLLGTNNVVDKETDVDSEWCGRIKHLENFVEHSLSSLEGRMNAAFSELENRIEQNRDETNERFEEYKACEKADRKTEMELMFDKFDQRFKEHEKKVKAERQAEMEMLEHRLADTIFKAVSASTRAKNR